MRGKVKEAMGKADLIGKCRNKQWQLKYELAELVRAAGASAPAAAAIERVRAIKDKAQAIEAIVQDNHAPARAQGHPQSPGAGAPTPAAHRPGAGDLRPCA